MCNLIHVQLSLYLERKSPAWFLWRRSHIPVSYIASGSDLTHSVTSGQVITWPSPVCLPAPTPMISRIMDYLTGLPIFRSAWISDIMVCSTGASQWTVLSLFLFTHLQTSELTQSFATIRSPLWLTLWLYDALRVEKSQAEVDKFVDLCKQNHLQLNISWSSGNLGLVLGCVLRAVIGNPGPRELQPCLFSNHTCTYSLMVLAEWQNTPDTANEQFLLLKNSCKCSDGWNTCRAAAP